ncbi:MAG: SDR family oxidoreductase [Anaerolineae bacterium]|jgi:nucleoside-diphosphate-sugar epimerase|nr:SDR family oxidoreductase [Anaerolineae bacterium]MBT7073187.1 SDR family oxidoreductase [Anaerolineae bacterium]MBT7326234.1 SDR family oxidoreductase [Anaerolineae bacterium]
MKVLFIGGTGIISSACSRLAIERGIELYHLNRGKTSYRSVPDKVIQLPGNIHDRASYEAALGEHQFDVVVQWIAFAPDQIEQDIEILRGRTQQYVFISSAAAYQTPPAHLPVTESTLLDNPVWEYARNKIACEERLVKAYRDEKFPMTIVRPSHTYDETLSPPHGGYAVLDRMLKGKPLVVHGDGTSLWTLTHHEDFAVGLVGLLGNSAAIGDVFHITSDQWLSWNQIYEEIARAAGVEAKLVHIPSEVIARYDKDWGDGLLGDKTHSMIFDNSKIRRVVPDFNPKTPFSEGARQIVNWYLADPARQVVDAEFDALNDKIIADHQY